MQSNYSEPVDKVNTSLTIKESKFHKGKLIFNLLDNKLGSFGNKKQASNIGSAIHQIENGVDESMMTMDRMNDKKSSNFKYFYGSDKSN